MHRLSARFYPRLRYALSVLSVQILAVSLGNAAFGQIVLSSDVPHEVALADPANPQQEEFDEFSWKSFVSLNWPAKADGSPATSTIGKDPAAPRVWEFYMHPKDVFLPGGATPVRGGVAKVGSQVQISKALKGFRGSHLDALQFPVVDQAGNYIVFDMRMNHDEFDYIVTNGLYSRAGQQGPSRLAEKFVSFPGGSTGGTVGAIELKTAWRILPATSGSSARYYTVATTLTIPAEESASGSELQLTVPLGLIGFHIAHKTAAHPQWIWSTFEHVDNLAAPPGGEPILTDPACASCADNNKPLPPGEPVPAEPFKPYLPPKKPYKWAATAPFAGSNQRIPTQAVRRTPVKARTAQLNHDWQAALRKVDPGSVWQYYQLISTQWPTKPFARKPGEIPGLPGAPSIEEFRGSPEPPLLANIPMETYNQDSSSCIHCHSRAFTLNGDYADFSYLLQMAQ